MINENLPYKQMIFYILEPYGPIRDWIKYNTPKSKYNIGTSFD